MHMHTRVYWYCIYVQGFVFVIEPGDAHATTFETYHIEWRVWYLTRLFLDHSCLSTPQSFASKERIAHTVSLGIKITDITESVHLHAHHTHSRQSDTSKVRARDHTFFCVSFQPLFCRHGNDSVLPGNLVSYALSTCLFTFSNIYIFCLSIFSTLFCFVLRPHPLVWPSRIPWLSLQTGSASLHPPRLCRIPVKEKDNVRQNNDNK